MYVEVRGRVIKKGEARGEALKTTEPISFYGGVDPETGIVIERGHELEGKNISGKILVFPQGKGSTVGSYVLLRLKKNGKAPLGIINWFCEPIVAVGAIISNIPTVDKIDICMIEDGDWVEISGERVLIKKKSR
ncbi:MAG: DUF126 domain-containing protein [Candidatus Caldarchaeales archaeon]